MRAMSCPNPAEHDAGDMLAVHRHAASYLKTRYQAAGARAVLLISLRCGCIVSHSSLRELDTEDGYDCVFLDRTSRPGKALCGIYEARPAQCRSWPFWPEMLETEGDWDLARRTTPCPGMNQGPVIPIEDIRIRRDATP